MLCLVAFNVVEKLEIILGLDLNIQGGSMGKVLCRNVGQPPTASL
jgi:hypothetical protein